MSDKDWTEKATNSPALGRGDILLFIFTALVIGFIVGAFITIDTGWFA